MDTKILSLVVSHANNGDPDYNQLFKVCHEDKTTGQFIDDYVYWKDEWIESNKEGVESDDALIDNYWNGKGYMVEYIVPDYEVNV